MWTSKEVGAVRSTLKPGARSQKPQEARRSVSSGFWLLAPGFHGKKHARGSALLAVLWLSAALAAIAFSLSSTVKSETERTSNSVDGLRAYYLAQGGIHRAAIELLWGATIAGPPPIPRGAVEVNYAFPTGNVHVEIIPETAKLDVNHATVIDLYRLLLALAVPSDSAQEIAAAIDDWRKPALQGSPFDLYYSSLVPSFRAPHASLQEVEELLLVKGITPDLYYGTYVPPPPSGPDDASARPLVPRNGLADCLSVYGSGNQVDANTATPEVLAAVGLAPEAIQAIVARRRLSPFDDPQLRAFMASIGAPAGRLRVGINSILMLRATARLRLADGQFSDLQRTVAAQVKYMSGQSGEPIHFLRWYDNAWSH
jgi:general secretion pathway protein K